MEQLKITKITGFDNVVGCEPKNVLDSNNDTHFSSKGIDRAFLLAEFDKTEDFDTISLSFFKGDLCKTKFAIAVGDKTIEEFVSSGETKGIQTFKLQEKVKSVKQLKILFKGNEANKGVPVIKRKNLTNDSPPNTVTEEFFSVVSLAIYNSQEEPPKAAAPATVIPSVKKTTIPKK